MVGIPFQATSIAHFQLGQGTVRARPRLGEVEK
jgi:hypothetical protein